MTAKTQAVQLALLERENARLKLLVARLAEWHNLLAGPLEASPDQGMTLAVQFPNGTVCWPINPKYVQGIWHQFSGGAVEQPTLEQEELILNQLISGVMVKTIRTYFNAPADKEEEQVDEARG